MIKAGLIGVTGYTGMEVTRILAGHPHMQLVYASSRTEAGKRVGTVYPFMNNLPGASVCITPPDTKEAAALCDVVFLAVPHGTAMNLVGELHAQGVRVVDLSADFRLRDAAVYEDWYKVPHTRKEILDQAVYGLPELYAKEISAATLVANPGCYPSCAVLGLYAALHHTLIRSEHIVIDAKSGATGSGRKATVSSLFCEVHDNFRAYGLGTHRHTPEIEQELSLLAQKSVTVSFNTHLLPVGRGILATIYTELCDSATTLQQVHDIYSHTWAESPWVRVLRKGVLPETRNVRGTMFCDIGLVVDPRTKRLIIVAAIDNLCRGAAGQAIANANLMFTLPLTSGLMIAPMMP
ncbi:MAG: N-acetyl-gamma-glutamyl-phosphate reductase [Desulfovibrionaceae bacterium]